MNQLIEWADGNPGAVTFLSKLISMENIKRNHTILKKIEEAKSIRGTNLWVLFSDLCDKDLEKVGILCRDCPISILEDACSRQDRSGKKLVAEWLPSQTQ